MSACGFRRCTEQVTHCDGACHGLNPDRTSMTQAQLDDLEDEKRFALEHAARNAVMEANAPSIEGVHYGNCYFDWRWKGCGFGQLDFRVNRETGEIAIANECMSRERVRKILHALADHIADTAVLDDN